MDRTRRRVVLGFVGLVCSLVVVITSASAMEGVKSTAQMLGLVAGSFAAGAAFVNLIRDYVGQRRRPVPQEAGPTLATAEPSSRTDAAARLETPKETI
jgi:hypothetical protein